MWEGGGELWFPSKEAVNKVKRGFPVRMVWMLASISSVGLLADLSAARLISMGRSPIGALAIVVSLLLLIAYPISVYVVEEKKMKILEVLANLDGKKVPKL